MRFIVSSSLLLKQLQAISGALSTNSTLPILDNFLFELSDTEIKISASDLETTMTTRLSVDLADGEGSIAVPAKMLLDTLKTLADIPITFDIDDNTHGIKLTAGEGKYKLSGQDGDDYPRVAELVVESSFKIESDVFYRAINKTLFATSNDDLRPVMTGVFCNITPEGVIFVSTDAHKLVRYQRSDVTIELEAGFILPKKPLNLLKNVLANDDDTVTIEFGERNARVTFQNIVMICRLVEGKFPNYSAVIPLENPNKMVVDRLQLLNSLRRVSIFSNKTTYEVKLEIAGRELTLSAEDLEYNNEAKERLECDYEGEDLVIGFNSRFLLEMLQNLETDQIRLEMSEPNRAGLITPVASTIEEEDILMLVMPVMLNY